MANGQVISFADHVRERQARTGPAPRRQTPAQAAPDTSQSRCAATTNAGKRCRNYATADGLCGVHARAGNTAGSGAQTPPVDEAFAHADETLRGRGYGPAVDGVKLLRQVARERWLPLRAASVVQRRLDGEDHTDEFGFDEELTTAVLLPLLRPLHQYYFRVTSFGHEHLPEDGGALIVSNHAGTLPVDALMTRLDIYDHTERHVRELGGDLLFRTSALGAFSQRSGVSPASADVAHQLLEAGELVAVWPEGYKGMGKPWKDRYRLRRFGRGGFITTAARANVPIVPTAIVGSEEVYPLLFDLRFLAKLLDLPYFPVVAQMLALPVLGPFAFLPLPSKWIIEYAEPIDVATRSVQMADDPMTRFDLAADVRDQIQAMLHTNLMGRRSIFM